MGADGRARATMAGMTDALDRRHVSLTRLDTGVYRATNARGDTLDFGSRIEEGFTPVELLMAALGGCSAVDVDVDENKRSGVQGVAIRINFRSFAGSRRRSCCTFACCCLLISYMGAGHLSLFPNHTIKGHQADSRDICIFIAKYTFFYQIPFIRLVVS